MRAMEAADALAADGWSVGVINARFAKPLDRQLILDQARGKRLVVTFEESVVTGGLRVGGPRARSRRRASPTRPTATCAVRIVGIPGDRFVDHGSVADLRRCSGSTRAGLAEQVRETLATLRADARPPARPAVGNGPSLTGPRRR